MAQPGSAPVLGTGGRRFESSRSDHFSNIICFAVRALVACPVDNTGPQVFRGKRGASVPRRSRSLGHVGRRVLSVPPIAHGSVRCLRRAQGGLLTDSSQTPVHPYILWLSADLSRVWAVSSGGLIASCGNIATILPTERRCFAQILQGGQKRSDRLFGAVQNVNERLIQQAWIC